jgi:hypothetical protein
MSEQASSELLVAISRSSRLSIAALWVPHDTLSEARHKATTGPAQQLARQSNLSLRTSVNIPAMAAAAAIAGDMRCVRDPRP